MSDSNKEMAALLLKGFETPEEGASIGDEVVLLWQDPEMKGNSIPLLLKVIGSDVTTSKVWGWMWSDPNMVFEYGGKNITPPPLMPVGQAYYSSEGKANHWMWPEEFEELECAKAISLENAIKEAFQKKTEAKGFATVTQVASTSGKG